jgi:hypothetical protein
MDFNWKEFLQQWSREILKFDNYALPAGMSLPSEVVSSQWLGYAGATEEEIAKAEARLGKTLPPSYRAFLKTSNGWRQTTPFIWELWSTREIEWYRVHGQESINAYTGALTNSDGSAKFSPSDEEYLVYGEQQREWYFRVEYLQTALQISEECDGSVYLLNPQIVTPEGEWEAWFMASWSGASRYRSFQELMLAEYRKLQSLGKRS